MKALYAYLRAFIQGSPIDWAQAQYEARNMITVSQVIVETIDSLALRVVSALQTYRLFLYVDLGLPVLTKLEKMHSKIHKSMLYRYLLRVAVAKTDMREIIRPQPRRSRC